MLGRKATVIVAVTTLFVIAASGTALAGDWWGSVDCGQSLSPSCNLGAGGSGDSPAPPKRTPVSLTGSVPPKKEMASASTLVILLLAAILIVQNALMFAVTTGRRRMVFRLFHSVRVAPVPATCGLFH